MPGQTLIFSGLIIEAIGVAVGFWLLYFLTKLAIKHAIQESGLIEALQHREPREADKKHQDMRDFSANS